MKSLRKFVNNFFEIVFLILLLVWISYRLIYFFQIMNVKKEISFWELDYPHQLEYIMYHSPSGYIQGKAYIRLLELKKLDRRDEDEIMLTFW